MFWLSCAVNFTVHGEACLVPAHGHRAQNGLKDLQGIPAKWQRHGLDPFRPEVLRRRAQIVTGVSSTQICQRPPILLFSRFDRNSLTRFIPSEQWPFVVIE